VIKVFAKRFNSYSGNHEFVNNKQNNNALRGTGAMDLVDLQDYLSLEIKLKKQLAEKDKVIKELEKENAALKEENRTYNFNCNELWKEILELQEKLNWRESE